MQSSQAIQPSLTRHTSPVQTDSLFGMVLAQAFMGAVFGAGVDLAWEAAEINSTVRMDRQKTPSGKNTGFEGKLQPKTLTSLFERAPQSLAEVERAAFTPAAFRMHRAPSFAR